MNAGFLARSVKELNEQALARIPPIRKDTKFKLYCNSALKLFDDGFHRWITNDLEVAYIYLFRMAVLGIERLRKHPEFYDPDPEIVLLRNDVKSKCLQALDILEKLRPMVQEYHDNLPPPLSPPPPVLPLTAVPPSLINGMRPLHIDHELLPHFTDIFKEELKQDKETLAVLSGCLLPDGSLKVTNLLIPRQTGTGNSCQSLDENQLFVYQAEHDLMPLGWIHSHPTQDCFLSSIDLHMQLSYQWQLPEAVAIVMAPKRKPNCGIFHLTSQGMEQLKKCPLSGFHPHLEPDLYNAAQHIILSKGNPEYKVIDFRSTG